MGLIARYARAVTEKPTYLSHVAIAFAANVPTLSSSGSVLMRDALTNQNVFFVAYVWRAFTVFLFRTFPPEENG